MLHALLHDKKFPLVSTSPAVVKINFEPSILYPKAQMTGHEYLRQGLNVREHVGDVRGAENKNCA